MAEYLQNYVPPEWAKHLRDIPKVKVQLAMKNTPIHKWNLPGVPKQFSLSIKRDDMTGCTLSGNKVSKLEFLMADAIAKNCTHVVTTGSLKSNQCRAVAVIARQLGLQPHLVLQTDMTDPESLGCEGNILLYRMCGAKMYLTQSRNMDKICEHITKTTGQDCYQIPRGGSNHVAMFGYLSVFDEMMSQGLLDDFDDIVFACGSGGTASSLIIANYLTGSKLRIHGMCVTFTAEHVHQHCNEMIKSVGLDVRSEDIFDVIEQHIHPGYGLSMPEQLDFVLQAGMSTGIILDHTYSGKAAYGMLQELENNPERFQGTRVLFIHTGGIYGLYDGRINEQLKAQGAPTNDVKHWTDF